MRKIITLMAMLLIYMLPALTAPAYAESHAKADVSKTDADMKKKKVEEEEEEEPECD